jgi:deaminated glutathione amidase
MTRVALLQMTAGIDPAENLDTIRRAARSAREGGAEMLFTPEMSLLLDRDRARATSNLFPEADDPGIGELGEVAASEGLFIALGSAAVRTEEGALANRSLLFAPDGEIVARYDKIHMFDVDLASGESWRESNAYRPGNDVIVVQDTPVGRLGLTICYDIRFPALFEALGARRCDVIAIPAAFTVPTGEAHWHLLQRARAVEASAWVVAAAQVGKHADGRRTYGHTLVVDPWGEVVLDMGGEETGVGFAEIDPARTAAVRRQLPSLANRRPIAN